MRGMLEIETINFFIEGGANALPFLTGFTFLPLDLSDRKVNLIMVNIKDQDDKN